MRLLHCSARGTAGSTSVGHCCHSFWSSIKVLTCSRAFIRAVDGDALLEVPSPTYVLEYVYDEHEGGTRLSSPKLFIGYEQSASALMCCSLPVSGNPVAHTLLGNSYLALQWCQEMPSQEGYHCGYEVRSNQFYVQLVFCTMIYIRHDHCFHHACRPRHTSH